MKYDLTIRLVDGSRFVRSGRTREEQEEVVREWQSGWSLTQLKWVEVPHNKGTWVFAASAVIFMGVDEAVESPEDRSL